MEKTKQTVVVLGASPKPERYSNQAVKLLVKHGHRVIPVHPDVTHIEGRPVAASLSEITCKVDTLTLYLSAAHSMPLLEQMRQLKPGRVIFNPGTENTALKSALESDGIKTEEACTLVLLNTGQF
jgi:predicted CoA-binding protein